MFSFFECEILIILVINLKNNIFSMNIFQEYNTSIGEMSSQKLTVNQRGHNSTNHQFIKYTFH